MSGAPAQPLRFGLSTMLLLVTLISVCLALIRIAPFFVVFILLVIVPALLRTAAAERVVSDGRLGVSNGSAKVQQFVVSLGAVMLIWTVGLFAILTTWGVSLAIVLIQSSPPADKLASFFGFLGLVVVPVSMFKAINKFWPVVKQQ